MRKILVDGDIVMYTALRSAEVEIEFSPANWFMFCDLNEAMASFVYYVNKYKQEAEADDIVIALSDYENVNFRKQINDTYKLTRAKTRKPLGYKAFTQMVNDKFDSVKYPELEADDTMGIVATNPNLPDDYVIVSDDKDLMQIPGLHLVGGKVVTVSKQSGDDWFLTQVLTGDIVDNYKGCPGVGPVKAAKILADADTFQERWERIVATYEKTGLDEDEAILQARMAKILQFEDYDIGKEEVRLWNPTTMV